MRSSRKRAQRQRAQADPVARRISSDLNAPRIDLHDSPDDAAVISAVDAKSRRAVDRSTHVDLAAGSEFIQLKPNEEPVTPPRRPAAPDPLTPAERAAEPPKVETDDPVDEASIDSFPASDPPSFTPTRAGRASPDPVDHRP